MYSKCIRIQLSLYSLQTFIPPQLYRLTRHSVIAKFSCDADLPIDEDAVDGVFVSEPASFHSNMEERSRYMQGNVDRIL